jgi:hypothetical protein
MTTTEYRSKALCYLCSYGDKAHKHVLALSRGEWSEPCKQNLIISNHLLDIFLCFPEDALDDFEESDLTTITEEEFEKLMTKLDSLLL